MNILANFSREVSASYRREDMSVLAGFYQAAVFTSNEQVGNLLRGGNVEVKLPFIGKLDHKLEPNYSNTVYSDVAVPRQITGGKAKARVAYMSEGILESNLETSITGMSVNQEVAGYLDEFWAGVLDHRTVSTIVGIRNAVMKDAAVKGDYVFDASVATGTPTEANRLGLDNFVEAESLLRHNQRGKGAMVIHPKMANRLRVLRVLEKVKSSDDAPALEYYNGYMLFESTEGTVVGVKGKEQYITTILSENSMIVEAERDENDMRIERTEATGNGGGHTALWTRTNALIHPQGFDFIADEDTLTGGTKNEAISASWEDLTDGANWKALDKNFSGIRFLITN